MSQIKQRYPRAVECGGSEVLIMPLKPEHEARLTEFVSRLSWHDMLFLRRDISNPKVMAAWLDGAQNGSLNSLVALDGDRIVGCTAIIAENLTWASHVGELRVQLDASVRGKGLGRVLVQECFVQALGMGLEKLCAQMTTDQTGAIVVFEELGFRAEALLRKQVRDRDHTLHDLVIMSHDVREFQAQQEAYGLADLFGAQGG